MSNVAYEWNFGIGFYFISSSLWPLEGWTFFEVGSEDSFIFLICVIFFPFVSFFLCVIFFLFLVWLFRDINHVIVFCVQALLFKHFVPVTLAQMFLSQYIFVKQERKEKWIICVTSRFWRRVWRVWKFIWTSWNCGYIKCWREKNHSLLFLHF